MGKIALPEMRKYKYDNTLATGCVAAAGTLGVMIPPSTVLIVYGILVEESIGKLFIAGVLPGILLSLAFVATVALLCFRNPELGPPGPQTTWKEKIRAAGGIVEAAILFFLAIGGLFLGWFSPTQAGAIGAGGALIIGLETELENLFRGRQGRVANRLYGFIHNYRSRRFRAFYGYVHDPFHSGGLGWEPAG
jgi:TRAP-type C4-dicarboxylate transport system permease large subunit